MQSQVDRLTHKYTAHRPRLSNYYTPMAVKGKGGGKTGERENTRANTCEVLAKGVPYGVLQFSPRCDTAGLGVFRVQICPSSPFRLELANGERNHTLHTTTAPYWYLKTGYNQDIPWLL